MMKAPYRRYLKAQNHHAWEEVDLALEELGEHDSREQTLFPGWFASSGRQKPPLWPQATPVIWPSEAPVGASEPILAS